MFSHNKKFAIEKNSLSLKASLIPWDTQIFGYPVAQIEYIEVSDSHLSILDFAEFESWRDASNCKLVSCRLGHQRLRESMLLEEKGFRFIETVLHPKLEKLNEVSISEQGLNIVPAEREDLPELQEIAESAFVNERFHVDLRLDPRRADVRYGRWVASTLGHPRQQLLKIIDRKTIVAFFIIELKENGAVYWHLTAVSPKYQGRGYGRRAWLTMLRYHQDNGHNSVSTTISARNTSVLNLYSSLNFRFSSPDMTFHWIRE